MLLLDVGEDQHALGADLPAIAQQVAGARLDHAFVGDVRKDEAFDAHEVGAAGLRHGERLAVGAGQDLHAERHGHLALDRARNRRHRGDDLRTNAAAQIRPIVHVLDRERREPAVTVDPRLRHGLIDELIERARGGRRTGQCAHVNHADQRPRCAKAFVKCRERSHGQASHRPIGLASPQNSRR